MSLGVVHIMDDDGDNESSVGERASDDLQKETHECFIIARFQALFNFRFFGCCSSSSSATEPSEASYSEPV